MCFSLKLDNYREMLNGIKQDYGQNVSIKQAEALTALYNDFKTDEEKAMFVAGLFF